MTSAPLLSSDAELCILFERRGLFASDCDIGAIRKLLLSLLWGPSHAHSDASSGWDSTSDLLKPPHLWFPIAVFAAIRSRRTTKIVLPFVSFQVIPLEDVGLVPQRTPVAVFPQSTLRHPPEVQCLIHRDVFMIDVIIHVVIHIVNKVEITEGNIQHTSQCLLHPIPRCYYRSFDIDT